MKYNLPIKIIITSFPNFTLISSATRAATDIAATRRG